jgi:glycosyltransferase involved in cell wall biosynthesis
MRVLVVTNSWPSEAHPYRVIVQRQVDALRRHGVDVDVLRVDGFRGRGNYARAALDILQLNVGRRRFDVVHGHTGHCGLLASLQLRYPVVVSYVGYDLDVPAEDFENIRTRVERWVFRALGLLVAQTIAKSKRGSRRVMRGARTRNVVIPNGVDRSLFRPIPRDEARRQLGWPLDARVVLFAADTTRYTKGFPLAEEAIARAKRDVAALELRIAHPVPPPEMPLWMNAADVLLLTSVAEGSPNVVKEAMACDLPVVSVDVGDVADVIGGAANCHVCGHDADELARALVDVLTPEPKRSDGRRRTEWLSDAAISERLLEVYRAAAGRGPGPLGFLRIPGPRGRVV